MFDNHTVLLGAIAGIYLLLAIATVVSHLLLNKRPKNETYRKVKTIVQSWWLLVLPPTIALVIGPLAVLLLFFCISCYVFIEFFKHSNLFSRPKLIISVMIACTVLQYLAIYLGWVSLFYSLIPLLLIWVLPLTVILKPDVSQLPRIGSLVFSPLLVSYYLSHIPALAMLDTSIWESVDQAMLAILILLFATEINDIMQFISGKAFGKRKPLPLLSPNKTEAGFLGGLVGLMILFSFVGPEFLKIDLPRSLILGLLISITGIFGDILFSAVKRYYRVKDFSDLIPGHGGLLDRTDSLILTAPVYFHLILFFKKGTL